MSTEFGMFNIAWLVWHTICLSSSAHGVTPLVITPDRMWCDFDLLLNRPINIVCMLGWLEIVVAWLLNYPETIISCLFGVEFTLNILWLNFVMREWRILTIFLIIVLPSYLFLLCSVNFLVKPVRANTNLEKWTIPSRIQNVFVCWQNFSWSSVKLLEYKGIV